MQESTKEGPEGDSWEGADNNTEDNEANDDETGVEDDVQSNYFKMIILPIFAIFSYSPHPYIPPPDIQGNSCRL